MQPFQSMLMAGVLLNSALYLTGVYVAGLLTGNAVAWKCALIGAGLCYICYVLQLSGNMHRLPIVVATVASIAFGIIAGLALLF